MSKFRLLEVAAGGGGAGKHKPQWELVAHPNDSPMPISRLAR
jgi:hypothetical protein